MLTRRKLLHALATATAGLLAGSRPLRALAQGSPDPTSLAEAGQGCRQRIALLSDPHIMAPGAPLAGLVQRKLGLALDDFARFAPDLYVINGDATDLGLPAEYAALGALLAQHAHGRPVLLNTGNHSFYDPAADDAAALARFCRFTGQLRPYRNLVRPGLHLILLSGERYKSAPQRTEWAWLSREQMDWLAGVLAEHPALPTLVCLHQPLHDSVLQSEQPNAFAGVGESDALRRLLAQHPQVCLWCSGHTHITAAAPRQVVRQDGVTFAALGSTFYLGRTPAEAEGPATGDHSASESRWLEVYPDRLRLRVRDHRAQAWLTELDLDLPLPPATPR